MITPDERWKPAQDRAAFLIAGGVQVKVVAETLDVGERTVWDWLSDPEYRALVSRYRGLILNEALGKLAGIMTKAVAVLEKVLDKVSARDSDRIRAAVAVLEQYAKIREHVELDDRITELERLAAIQGEKGGMP